MTNKKMTIDEKYMWRCLQLASKGKGQVSPNPMVGSVIVCNDKIIGEGFHRVFGSSHAEVNAINSVEDKLLLPKSTLYVSLEPCSHYGKTPPCAELIIKHKIPRVVIACTDPYPEVSGRGIKLLKDMGVNVKVGVLEQEAKVLNSEFFKSQLSDRPFIYLKWAQSNDGFIDKERSGNNESSAKLSNDFTQICVHKLRTRSDAIMIGTTTAIKDNPRLTSRLWDGKNPIRVVLDRLGRIPENSNLFDNEVQTIIFTEVVNEETVNGSTHFVPIKYDENLLQNIFKELQNRKINSVMVEGGLQLLQQIIDNSQWDEAYIEIADKILNNGVNAPNINGTLIDKSFFGNSLQLHLKS